MMTHSLDDKIVLEHIQDLKRIISSTGGKLIKSKISPKDYFVNLSNDAPTLKYPEDLDESNSISKVIVMIFEYYFLVGPILFKDQGARFVNDVTFMKHFMKYIKSLCNSRPQAQKELGNILVALDLHNPLRDIVC